MIDDPARGLVEPAEPDWTEVHLPESVIDFLETHVELREHVTDVHPAAPPANATVATDASHFIMPRIGDRQEPGGVGPRRRVVQACGQTLTEGLVRPLGVVALPKPIEAPLLGGERASRGPRGLGLDRLVHPLVPAILLGVSGLDELGLNAEPDHQTESVHSRPSAFEANGAPLSVR